MVPVPEGVNVEIGEPMILPRARFRPSLNGRRSQQGSRQFLPDATGCRCIHIQETGNGLSKKHSQRRFGEWQVC
ncbi:hypothetical protein C6Y56_06010 [Pseudomonas fluorescens]|uniref:Uncharacterized protein n=1 Tax=Pseudomonas fluorescens TaxID=294 RepID=A0A7Z3C2N2_PSEFL|nr:hypothetical protein C6Y56_06010 [Pseudomonas fluorescens]